MKLEELAIVSKLPEDDAMNGEASLQREKRVASSLSLSCDMKKKRRRWSRKAEGNY